MYLFRHATVENIHHMDSSWLKINQHKKKIIQNIAQQFIVLHIVDSHT